MTVTGGEGRVVVVTGGSRGIGGARLVGGHGGYDMKLDFQHLLGTLEFRIFAAGQAGPGRDEPRQLRCCYCCC
jgi:hypothetical protein